MKLLSLITKSSETVETNVFSEYNTYLYFHLKCAIPIVCT